MEIADIIGPDQVLIDLRAGNKLAALKELARRAGAGTALTGDAIYAALIARENMGSTGVGQGIAVPHARVEGLKRPFALFARLERPIDFESIDGRPVDLVFLLLTPSEAGSDHLAALACVSRRVRDGAVAQKLREAVDARGLYNQLMASPTLPNA